MTRNEHRVICNYHYRDAITWEDLTSDEQSDFDWMDELDRETDFYRYKGHVYSLHCFMRAHDTIFDDWHGVASDSYFSGVLIKYDLHENRAILATYLS